MGYILNEVRDSIEVINLHGTQVGNTKEVRGRSIILFTDHLDMEEEEMSIKSWYGTDDFNKKLEDEYNHYEYLKHGMLHKIKEVKFFHNQGIDSRKFVIFSQDCISLLQYLNRDGNTVLMVHMRSSDAINLLPLDLLFLVKILKEINKTYCAEVKEEILEIFIGSAHIYTNDSPRG